MVEYDLVSLHMQLLLISDPAVLAGHSTGKHSIAPESYKMTLGSAVRLKPAWHEHAVPFRTLPARAVQLWVGLEVGVAVTGNTSLGLRLVCVRRWLLSLQV